MKRLLLLFIALGLIAAVVVQCLPKQSPATSDSKTRRLDEMFVTRGDGWTSVEVPLGQTEAVQGAVEKTLRYDDVLFRQYTTTTGDHFTLYIAYWDAGKMPTQLVASHTPDRCWTSAGWQCDEIRHGVAVADREGATRPGEFRRFTAAGGTVQYVVYWQLVGDDLYDFGDRFNQVPSAWRWLRDAFKQMFVAPPAQYFVRLASDQPLEKIKGDPALDSVLSGLRAIGLGA